MGKKIFYFIIAVIILVALYYIVGPIEQSDKGPTPGDNLSIEEKFDDKIVYTTNTELDASPFRSDCEARDGIFEECGTVCDLNTGICSEVCAYTCVLGDDNNLDEVSTTTEDGINKENTTSTDLE